MAKILWKEMTLFHPDTEKYWQITVEGNNICTCLNHGKEKIKEEKYPEEKAIQAVMAQFRKGFLYSNPGAQVWEPVMHRYVNNIYTGFMPIASRPDREDFYILRTEGSFEDEIIYHYDGAGHLLSTCRLGAKRLTFDAIMESDGTLYLNNDHHIEHFYPDQGRLELEDSDKNQAMFAEKGTQAVACKNLKATENEDCKGIEIRDTRTDKLLTVVRNEFTVHNANYSFSSNRLIVHTDYGVLSIYSIDNPTCDFVL